MFLTKQLHYILFLIMFLDELLASLIRWVLLVVVVDNVLELLIVAEEEIANNDLHDLGR